MTFDTPLVNTALNTRLYTLLLTGTGISLVLLLALSGVRADLTSASTSWPFCLKLSYALCMALIGWLLLDSQLHRPAGRLWGLMALPMVLLAVLAIRTSLRLPADVRLDVMLGHSWRSASLSIAALSLPSLALLCRLIRRVSQPSTPAQQATAATSDMTVNDSAVTDNASMEITPPENVTDGTLISIHIHQPRACAAALGLLSGALGALVYSLHCTETSISFISTWYTLGMLIPTLYGALMGRQLLAQR